MFETINRTSACFYVTWYSEPSIFIDWLPRNYSYINKHHPQVMLSDSQSVTVIYTQGIVSVFVYSSKYDACYSPIFDITFSFSRSLQLGMITEHALVSKSMSFENNHCKLKPSSAQRVSEPSIDIDSRPPAPLPPEVSASLKLTKLLYCASVVCSLITIVDIS